MKEYKPEKYTGWNQGKVNTIDFTAKHITRDLVRYFIGKVILVGGMAHFLFENT